MILTPTDQALLRLLQLSSAALPVGGFSYSLGLEYAIDKGWIKHCDDLRDWLSLQLNHSLGHLDLAVVARLYPALNQGDRASVEYWNGFLVASRETRELRLSDTACGGALLRLLPNIGVPPPLPEDKVHSASFVTVFVAAAAHWEIAERHCALGLAWSWLENQVAAATKLLPLGQTQAQRLLGELQAVIPGTVRAASQVPDEHLGATLPMLAIASSLHETQYSRLFRS